MSTATIAKTAPEGYVTRPYDGPIIRRGETVRYTDMQGVVTVGRVQRVVLLRGYYDPTVIVERYLAIEGVGTLTPTSNGGIEVITPVLGPDEPSSAVCPVHGAGCEAWA